MSVSSQGGGASSAVSARGTGMAPSSPSPCSHEPACVLQSVGFRATRPCLVGLPGYGGLEMELVTFLSLLLGLVVGECDVELMVSEQVATVDILLDSEKITTLAGSPLTGSRQPWQHSGWCGSRVLTCHKK